MKANQVSALRSKHRLCRGHNPELHVLGLAHQTIDKRRPDILGIHILRALQPGKPQKTHLARRPIPSMRRRSSTLAHQWRLGRLCRTGRAYDTIALYAPQPELKQSMGIKVELILSNLAMRKQGCLPARCQ